MSEYLIVLFSSRLPSALLPNLLHPSTITTITVTVLQCVALIHYY